MTLFLLIAVAVIPVIIIFTFVYRKDKNREPMGLAIGLFASGIAACFLVLTLSNILSSVFPFMNAYNSYLDVFLHAFVGVALVEEVCKFLMTYAFAYHSKEVDEIYDLLAYSVFTALGFACFENILYVLGKETASTAIKLGLFRGVTSIPGHACYGLFMGYYLSLAKVSAKRKNKIEERNNILKAIFIPTLLHGIYDFCCFIGIREFMYIFIVFIIAVDYFALKKLNYVAKINRGINERAKRQSPLVEILENSSEYNEEAVARKDDTTVEANSYNKHDEKKSSEYFTIIPVVERPTAGGIGGDSFKFEGTGVPYIPEILPEQENAGFVVSREQSADYIPPIGEIIPEIDHQSLLEQQTVPPSAISDKKFCVYCGAEITGPFCQSCGHEVK